VPFPACFCQAQLTCIDGVSSNCRDTGNLGVWTQETRFRDKLICEGSGTSLRARLCRVCRMESPGKRKSEPSPLWRGWHGTMVLGWSRGTLRDGTPNHLPCRGQGLQCKDCKLPSLRGDFRTNPTTSMASPASPSSGKCTHGPRHILGA
jgi:hypothetical protein